MDRAKAGVTKSQTGVSLTYATYPGIQASFPDPTSCSPPCPVLHGGGNANVPILLLRLPGVHQPPRGSHCQLQYVRCLSIDVHMQWQLTSGCIASPYRWLDEGR